MKLFHLFFSIAWSFILWPQESTNSNSPSQDNYDSLHANYPFIFMDRPALLFTMRQMNENALSLYRMFGRYIYNKVKLPMDLNTTIVILFDALFFIPLTHEEGHRSILTRHKIGSISQPYFNKYGAAYVKGVADSTLKRLRDSHLPDYIRLHSAGLESDYMFLKQIETLLAFQQERYSILQWTYLLRKISVIQYLASGLFKIKVNIKEEPNELDRDIVGHDVYSFARHIYRPHMTFYRYTEYHDLTNEEKRFIRRIGFRSFLNALHPSIVGIPYFTLNRTHINLGLGYMLAPFGDFIELHIWSSWKKWNISTYFRGYQNKHTWFPAIGISMSQYPLFKHFFLDAQIHIWQQPQNLSFNTSTPFTGFAVDGLLQYHFPALKISSFNYISLNLGMLYKTKGFLPQEVNLSRCLSPRIGLSIFY
ncbi:MAG: hypothetical protein N2Z72_06450 [Bacteroidales bacterium]|nr:hypothetical protein [Bacteroidales bacterium]